MELGGKSPIIVEPDCDMDGALNSAILGFCMNQGEVCVSTSRLLLADEIYDEFLEKMTARLSRIKIGDCLKEDTQMGSLISGEHLQTVQGLSTGLRHRARRSARRPQADRQGLRQRFLLSADGY